MSDRHQTKPYPLRMPEELREALQAKAAESRRSLNAEIVARLESSLLGEQIDKEMDEYYPDVMLRILNIARDQLLQQIESGEAGKGLPPIRLPKRDDGKQE